jgi:hypothetical protein
LWQRRWRCGRACTSRSRCLTRDRRARRWRGRRGECWRWGYRAGGVLGSYPRLESGYNRGLVAYFFASAPEASYNRTSELQGEWCLWSVRTGDWVAGGIGSAHCEVKYEVWVLCVIAGELCAAVLKEVVSDAVLRQVNLRALSGSDRGSDRHGGAETSWRHCIAY